MSGQLLTSTRLYGGAAGATPNLVLAATKADLSDESVINWDTLIVTHQACGPHLCSAKVKAKGIPNGF